AHGQRGRGRQEMQGAHLAPLALASSPSAAPAKPVDQKLLRLDGRQRLGRHDPAVHRRPDGPVVLKAFRYRLYPSKPQRRRLDATLETARRWYNDCLAQRRAPYELVGWTVNHTYQLSQVKDHKASNPFAAGVHSHVLQLVCTDLKRAFAAFFRRLKA